MNDLIIDKEFKRLSYPLPSREYKKIKASILAGQTQTIVAWKNIIIDGFEQYEISKKVGMDCDIMCVDFPSREAVIVFVCKCQLRRKDIPDPMRHYLIGKQYIAEITINKNNSEDVAEENGTTYFREKNGSPTAKHRVAFRIGEVNKVSHATVQKYGEFVASIDSIAEKVPGFVTNVLNSKYKVSHNNVLEIANLSVEDIRRVEERIIKEQEPYIKYHDAMSSVRQTRGDQGSYSHFERNAPSVKDMPKFDPDAEITGLTLTIPSWMSSIDRVIKNTKFDLISEKATIKLNDALYQMIDKIKELDDKLQGVKHE